MNRLYRLTSCLSVAALAGAAPPAMADTAALSIDGRVLAGTCTLTAPALALASIKADELVPGDNTLTAGALEFSGCIGVTKAVLSFDGVAADGDPLRWKNTAASTPATGVSIALLEGTNGSRYLKKGDTGIELVVSGATARFPLRAGYYLVGGSGVNAGLVHASIVVTAAYQ